MKKITPILLALCLIVVAAMAISCKPAPIDAGDSTIGEINDSRVTVYVDATGDNATADGTAERPYSTITAARDAVRTLDKTQYSGITVFIKNGEYMHCVNTNEILYLEACNKHCLVSLEKEKIICNKTMARIYETLPKTQFLKINRAFVINCNYVEKYNRENVILKNGEALPLSRNYVKEFKMNFQSNMEFMRM